MKHVTATENPLLQKYIAQIPRDLRHILIPRSEQGKAKLAAAVKAFRLRQVERNYVLDLQQYYKLPTRPNETVKQTMIRVRLAMLKRRRAAGVDRHRPMEGGVLPIDPLE
jgi:hypothetical protein